MVSNRIGNFYAGVILYFLVSVMRRSESWRDWLVLRFLTRRRSLPYTSSEKPSALATSWGSTTALDADLSGELPPEVERVALESATPLRADAFLAPVSIDERKDALGPHPSRNGRRSSDKGFLTMAEAEYLEILDWLARDRVAGKRGATPLSAPPVLERLGIEPTLWLAMVRDFGRAFMNVAGTVKSVSEARSRKTHRKFYRARV